jgi:type IV pilus assembly protein PilQ
MVGQSSGGSRTSIQAGIRLQITPWTGGEGTILAHIEPEISTLSADDPITGLPEMSSRKASTWVRLKDSQTIVIGGLTQREKRSTIGGIPILKDLPLIGKLFQRRSSEEIDTELVIFVTPRRLSAEGKLPPEEEARLKEKFGLEELNGAL